MDNNKTEDKVVLAKLDLTGCSTGGVLFPREKDQSITAKYFSGWENHLTSHPSWGRASMLQVVMERGKEVLEHTIKEGKYFVNRCLITGDLHWQNYCVEARLRHMNDRTYISHDEPYTTVGRTGLVLRQQDVRQYYFFCIEEFTKLVLYYRKDDAYYPLVSRTGAFNSKRYYTLRAEMEGERFRCFLEGELVFAAEHSALPSGKAGIRSNTNSRFEYVRITTTRKHQTTFVSRMDKHEKAIRALRAAYPQPVLWRKLTPDFEGEFTCRFGDIRGTGKKDIVLFKAGREKATGRLNILQGIGAMDLEGNMLWFRNDVTGATMNARGEHVADLNGDGVDEIVCGRDDMITILDGRTGKTILETAGPYKDGKIISMGCLCFCNLQGHKRGKDMLFWGGGGTGNSIWAYDGNMSLLWKYTADKATESYFAAHCVSFYDVNGDGRDEVLSGYRLLDSKGKLLWELEQIDDLREHPDTCILDEFDENGPKAAIAGGGDGFWLLNGVDGKILSRHMVGHAQDLSIGNFRPDLPGLEILCGNRWDNYGILNLFSAAGEPLARFQPDSVSSGGPAVNWKGDGGELIFLNSSRKAFGMYDGYGRKVVAFPELEDGPAGSYYHRWEGQTITMDLIGDARDEVIVVHNGVIYIFTQDEPFIKGKRIYAPVRKMGQEAFNPISKPGWQTRTV